MTNEEIEIMETKKMKFLHKSEPIPIPQILNEKTSASKKALVTTL
jgi:hypothetical protein